MNSTSLRQRLSTNRIPRRAVTLLELLAMLTIMGILAATAAPRFGRATFSQFGSEGELRKLNMAMLWAQRAAITTGDDHYVELLTVSGQYRQYRIVRDTGTTTSVINGPNGLSPDVTITASSAILRFTFSGGASANHWVQAVGGGKTWRLDVIGLTGTMRTTRS